LTKGEQLDLLLFVTARRTLPPGGFPHLDPAFTVIRGTSDPRSLPSSHTCSNQLELPVYESEAQLRERMQKVLELGVCGFGVA
jgi:E3 ubiquitin-protein ligase HUWE1